MGNVRVGLFGIGLDAYWPQFAGLKERLEGYLDEVRRKIERPGVDVVSLGLIDSPPKAFEAGHRFRREDVDLIFLHVTTYALSSTVLPVVQRAASLPRDCSTAPTHTKPRWMPTTPQGVTPMTV